MSTVKAKSVSRSDAIRSYIKSHPKESNKEVIAGLAASGIVVQGGLVSNVRHNMKAGKAAAAAARAVYGTQSAAQPATKRGRRRQEKQPTNMPTRPNGLTAQHLLDAKRLADSIGGIESAKQALEFLSQLK